MRLEIVKIEEKEPFYDKNTVAYVISNPVFIETFKMHLKGHLSLFEAFRLPFSQNVLIILMQNNFQSGT